MPFVIMLGTLMHIKMGNLIECESLLAVVKNKTIHKRCVIFVIHT